MISGKKVFRINVDDVVFKGYVEFNGPKLAIVYLEEPVRLFVHEWKLPDNVNLVYDYLETDEPMIHAKNKVILNLKPHIKKRISDMIHSGTLMNKN